MNPILQKRIEEAARYIAELCPDCDLHCKGTNPCIPKILYQKLIEISIFALQNQWISVEEALPTEQDKEDEQYSTNVFARTKDCIRYAYYDFYNESWCSVEGGYRFGGDVTHWMPIQSLEGGER